MDACRRTEVRPAVGTVLEKTPPCATGSGLQGVSPRRNETHLLELSKELEQHFFGFHPLVETVLPRLGSIGHDIVVQIKDCFSEGPGDRVLKGVF